MPGRQAHGRSLVANPKAKAPNKKSKARSQKNALDAFGIAQERFPTTQKKTPRARELDAELERKHGRVDGDDEEDEEEDEEPQRKKAKPSRPVGEDADYGSDSEGNEWRLGGLKEDDEDSEIESDDAFGDSDNEKFQEYSFRGTKSKKTEVGRAWNGSEASANDLQDNDSEDDSEDDEGETLGAEAIDLATALDQFEDEPDEPEGDESGSEESDDEASDESDDEASDESDDSDESDGDGEDDEEADSDRLDALRGMISEYGGEKDDAKDQPSSKPKIDLGDLGLAGLNDPFMKKSVKLMKREEKEKRPGAAKKLDAPLPKRQQDRVDRAAAYEKTNETLDRWTETVKQNRRAEHLVFPLPQNAATAGLDTTEIQPLTAKSANTELESTIMSIMEQSGLSMEQKAKAKPQEFDDEGNLLSRKEAMTRRRMERELNDREAKRAKRIKKIKSKAYHRVHRKQRERDEMAAKEAMEEAGEIDSEEEREAQDRRRALERVGQRHKESKWAKIGSRAKRAVWDEDFRAGLTEMARKDEELRRRKEGRRGGPDDDDSDATSSSGDDDNDALRRRLDELEEKEDRPQSGLMGMKFMQKAEAAKKRANDEMIEEIRRELDGEEAGDSDEETGEVGRRRYGTTAGAFETALDTSKRAAKRDRARGVTEDPASTNGSSETAAAPAETAASTAGAWSRGETRRKKKGSSSAQVEELDLNANVLVAARPSKPQPRKGALNDETSDSDSDADQHLPLAIRDQELVARAFAGEDVVGEFEREKAEVAEADDDKVIDNTLPGWGSWVGDGVSNREKKRHQGRFLTKVEGIKKKDRKDAKLDKVIVNEKRIKKVRTPWPVPDHARQNDRYLASQLPHPFESRQQYERSLRLPVGPEWMTKETLQDSTKPRVLMKQGIITPISKPTA
ncbi:U3 small nucleolar RNA-associated protein 14 [Tolypocladium ophioglossoides CBS 100239]|uniref:U3 small nucleolar RNA-associated protein 14 n=1 Tax=Tolypocladium ophioglossoides (strain CBS 100239) TaxID=1163406 RepID=A0A0L0N9F3_TOLOC|nr:U3 small nucleolar RNA-associated protein 14 [Tolypocladium ophioglossoides CBS 100239]